MRQPPSVSPIIEEQTQQVTLGQHASNSFIPVCELPYLIDTWMHHSRGTPSEWYRRIAHRVHRSHRMDSETQRELGLLLRHQSAHCCTSLFDDYEIQLPLWSVNIPTCDLLSTTKPLKQVRWRKFCCKHTSTIYFDSKVRQDNQNPSAMHSAEENSNHAVHPRTRQGEWERVWIRPGHQDSTEPARPVLSERDRFEAKELARLRAFNMYNQSRDYPEEMISHDSFLLQDPDYQPAKSEHDDYSVLSEQEPSPRFSHLSQSEISSQCSDNSSVGTSAIQHLHDSSPCTEF